MTSQRRPSAYTEPDRGRGGAREPKSFRSAEAVLLELDSGYGAELLVRVIQTELEVEAGRKSSLENRGNSVITTSGALVTLLFALSTLVTGQDKYQAPRLALMAIVLALALFVTAAVLGLLTNRVVNYQRVKVADIEQTIKEQWHSITVGEAQTLIVGCYLKMLRSARETTSGKAAILRSAVLAEVGAVALLACAVIIVIIDGL